MSSTSGHRPPLTTPGSARPEGSGAPGSSDATATNGSEGGPANGPAKGAADGVADALAPGLIGELRMVVTEDDTALAVGSGDVPVLATPRLLAFAEAATVAAVREHLPAGATSVGTTVALSHLAAGKVGAEVMARAELTEVDGRRLVFTVEAHEGDRLVGTGRIERIVVDRERFLSRLG